jgi:hypothetical protein
VNVLLALVLLAGVLFLAGIWLAVADIRIELRRLNRLLEDRAVKWRR